MNFLIKSMILFFATVAFISLVFIYSGVGKIPASPKPVPVGENSDNIFHAIMSYRKEVSAGLEKEWKNVHKIKIMKYDERTGHP